jgi:hypothetical protein
VRVLRDEGPRGHVEVDHGGAVCADTGREEPVAPAETVEELGTIVECAHHQRAVAARTLRSGRRCFGAVAQSAHGECLQ